MLFYGMNSENYPPNYHDLAECNQGRFRLVFFQIRLYIEAMMYLPCLMSIGIGISNLT